MGAEEKPKALRTPKTPKYKLVEQKNGLEKKEFITVQVSSVGQSVPRLVLTVPAPTPSATGVLSLPLGAQGPRPHPCSAAQLIPEPRAGPTGEEPPWAGRKQGECPADPPPPANHHLLNHCCSAFELAGFLSLWLVYFCFLGCLFRFCRLLKG